MDFQIIKHNVCLVHHHVIQVIVILRDKTHATNQQSDAHIWIKMGNVWKVVLKAVILNQTKRMC